MAQEQSINVETRLFISRTKENEKLKDALAKCGTTFHQAIGLLYAPHKCFLAIVKREGEEWRFYEGSSSKESGKEVVKEKEISADSVFEARVFNSDAELRWLNKADGKGSAVVLCKDDSVEFFDVKPELFKTKVKEEEKDLVGTIEQTYLLWGQSVAASNGDGWAQFAEARIGSFFVPVKNIKGEKQRAQFTAVEYLGEYEDGNVAVIEERLTGIAPVEMKQEAQSNG